LRHLFLFWKLNCEACIVLRMTGFVLIAFIFNESYTLHSITLPLQRTYNSWKNDTPSFPVLIISHTFRVTVNPNIRRWNVLFVKQAHRSCSFFFHCSLISLCWHSMLPSGSYCVQQSLIPFTLNMSQVILQYICSEMFVLIPVSVFITWSSML
jgi:hypothetical protein